MSPWIGISVSLVSTVVMALVGFIVKRELGRLATDLGAIRKKQDSQEADLKAFVKACKDEYMSKETFHTLDDARREVEEIRRGQDGRLENLITQLLAKYGG